MICVLEASCAESLFLNLCDEIMNLRKKNNETENEFDDVNRGLWQNVVKWLTLRKFNERINFSHLLYCRELALIQINASR